MEKENEGNLFNQITNPFIRYPKVSVTVITVFACGVIGLIIYLAPGFGNGQNTNTASKALNFDLPTGSQQDQGAAVQGANTQAAGPEEQSSGTPSSASVSETPTSTASVSATPTETPAPTSSPTSAPTATPQPTAAPTASPTPTITPTPTTAPSNSPSPSQ